jgi:uncharacterized protein
LQQGDPGIGSAGAATLPAVSAVRFNRRVLGFDFCGERFEVSVTSVLALSFIVGLVGGVYGIGGGAILAPVLVSFYGLPIYVVAGATLMGTFATSVAGVAFYQALAPFYPQLSVAPDCLLGVLFGVGGMAGMYLGARCQKFVPARVIKCLLGGVIVITVLQYVATYLEIV